MTRFRVLWIVGVLSISMAHATQTWQLLWPSQKAAQQPPQRAVHSIGVLGDSVYIFGGVGDTEITHGFNDTWRFDIRNQSWHQIQVAQDSERPEPRYAHDMIMYHNPKLDIDQMFIFGGALPSASDELARSDELWRLDMTSPPRWHKITASSNSKNSTLAPSARSEFSMTKYRDSFILFGGVSLQRQEATNLVEPSVYNDLWMYNITLGTWELMVVDHTSDTPHPRFSHQASMITLKDEYLLVAGGRGMATTSVSDGIELLTDGWLFSLKLRKWFRIPFRNTYYRSYNSLVVYNSSIWAFGGYIRSYQTNKAYVFDDIVSANLNATAQSVEWKRAEFEDQMTGPHVRFQHRAVMWKDMMIIHGGRFNEVHGDMWGINVSTLTQFQPLDEDYFFMKESQAVQFLLFMLALLSMILFIFIAVLFRKFNTRGANVSDENRPQGLDHRTIQEFKIIRYTSPKNSRNKGTQGFTEDDEEDEDVCPICLTDLEIGAKLRQLPCDHVFHPKCIDEWLDKQNTCPMCKMNLDPQTEVATTNSALNAAEANA